MDFFDEVVHEVEFGAHFDGWVEQARRTNELFNYHTFSTFQFILSRGGGDIDGLWSQCFELFKTKGTIVKCGRKTEGVIDQILFATSVTSPHRFNLWNGLVALIDDEQVVVGKEIEKTIGTFAFLAPIKIAGIVFNARAMTCFANPFEVVGHPQLYLFRFLHVAQFLIVEDALVKVILDVVDGFLSLLLGGHEEVGWIDFVFIVGGDGIECLHVQFLYFVYGIIEITNAQNFLIISKIYIDSLSLHTELSTLQFVGCSKVIVGIEHVHQFAAKSLLRKVLVNVDGEDVFSIAGGCTHTIDAGNRGDNDDVFATRKQS